MMRSHSFPAPFVACLIAAALWLVPLSGRSQVLRVLSWNLGTNSALEKAAALLKQEAPDVVLLQQIPDWKFCSQLLQFMKSTNYQVLVCSAWSQPSGQSAILSRHPAYFSWYAPWTDSSSQNFAGGYSFAAISVAGRRVGVFSAQLGDDWPLADASPSSIRGRRADAVSQVLDQVKAVQEWVANRPESFVLGGTFNSSPETAPSLHAALLSQLQDARFGDLATQLPANARQTRRLPRGTADYIFTRPDTLARQLRVLSANLAPHEPVICEIELDPAKQLLPRPAPESLASLAPADANPAQSPATAANVDLTSPSATQAETRPMAAIPSQPQPAGGLNPWWIAFGLGLLLLFSVWLLILRWRGPRPAPSLIADRQAPAGATSYVIVTPNSMTATHAGGFNDSRELHPLVPVDSLEASSGHHDGWRQRALLAEQQSALDRESLRTGLKDQLADWLKQRFVRKIVADRAAMIQAQNAAALQALAVDERLARIEKQIQDQNEAYERRIAELTTELNAARSENREMIRSRISQVKAEMLKARERLMAEARQGGQEPPP